MGKMFTRVGLLAGAAALTGVLVVLFGIALANPEVISASTAPATYEDRQGDQELAYLLVKLELKTRAVMAGHYTRSQSAIPGVDLIYSRWIAKNRILPAAVADGIFSDVVPGATGGRAWVKMVVANPRNPNNRGDEVAADLLRAIQTGEHSAERSTSEAYYYGEPITARPTCLPCHGEPRGAADPLFPEYKKDGWKDGEIIGAVIARVAPEV